MKINKFNYESFFVDYLDGNLSGELFLEFEAFLSLNPELSAEIKELDKMKFNLSDEILNFDKNRLYTDKNSISFNAFTDNCIAYMENELDESQQKKFLNSLNTNYERKELSLYQKTKLQKQKSVFPAKKSLYRHALYSNWIKVVSVAALLAIIFSLSVFRAKPVSIKTAQVPKINFPRKSIAKNRANFVSLQKYNRIEAKQILTKFNKDSDFTKDALLRKSNIQCLSMRKKTNLNSFPEREIIIQNTLNKKFRINNIYSVKVLAYSKWSESDFKKVLDSKNKFWASAKFIMIALAKITKKQIEVKDDLSPNGKLEYLVISTPKFKYERSFSTKD